MCGSIYPSYRRYGWISGSCQRRTVYLVGFKVEVEMKKARLSGPVLTVLCLIYLSRQPVLCV